MKNLNQKSPESLKQLIEKCNFSYVNEDITGENFPRPDKIQTENWKIIRINKTFTSQEALDEIKKQGCHPANVWEMLVLFDEWKNELKDYEYLLAFGQLWEDGAGSRRVPRVYRRSGGDWLFRLGFFEDDWHGDYCLLCLCDPAMEKPNNIKISKVNEKYFLENEGIKIFAEIVDNKITIYPEYGEKKFIFINSDKEKAKKILNLMLEATKL
jgi:hypothetical protein